MCDWLGQLGQLGQLGERVVGMGERGVDFRNGMDEQGTKDTLAPSDRLVEGKGP